MYCEHCGAYASDGSRFCSSCGKGMGTENQQSSENQEHGPNGGYERPGYDTRPMSTEREPLAVLCYFGIFLLIPFLMKQDSQFVRYHANQGLILLIFYIICGVILIIPILGWIVSIVGYLFSFVCLIMGVVNVLGGKMKPMPLIGKFELLK